MDNQTRPASHGDGIVTNPHATSWACPAAPAEAATFHRSVPGYAPTPLRELPPLAQRLGVGRVFLKDESTRFGLPAFKALGVSFAIHRLVHARTGQGSTQHRTPDDWDGLLQRVRSMPPFTLVTATDGNHGRAVARFARLLGLPAHVFVPDVVSAAAIQAIRDEGAQVSVLAADYDTAVQRAAAAAADDPDAELLQDTAWPGYEVVPQWIVDGYSTLLVEVDDQLARAGVQQPDAVVVPMGVGSFAQAVVTHYRSGASRPTLVGVEPDTAACIQASILAGRAVSVDTAATIMAGLNCGTPSSLSWPLLQQGLDLDVAVSDADARAAMERLEGLGVHAGACGAATLAALEAVSRSGDLHPGPQATVVLLSTEGRLPATA